MSKRLNRRFDPVLPDTTSLLNKVETGQPPGVSPGLPATCQSWCTGLPDCRSVPGPRYRTQAGAMGSPVHPHHPPCSRAVALQPTTMTRGAAAHCCFPARRVTFDLPKAHTAPRCLRQNCLSCATLQILLNLAFRYDAAHPSRRHWTSSEILPMSPVIDPNRCCSTAHTI